MILSFLGAGKYERATYHWESHPPKATPLFVAALCAWFPEEAVVVLSSPTARARNEALLLTEIPQATLVDIPDGATDEQNWDLFGIIGDVVQENDTVIFDVTHGFRSMPLVGTLTLAYLRAVRGVTLRHVLYGAFQPGRPESEPTPAFDLTPFTKLLDWAEAAGRFRETGDARKFGHLMREAYSPLNRTAGQLRQLSEALSYNRGMEVGPYAEELMDTLTQIRQQETFLNHRPFQLIVEQIERTVRPLAHPRSAGGLEVLQALFRRVQWYADRDHFVQAISLAREWMVLAFIWFSVGDIDLTVARQTEASQFLSSFRQRPGAEAPVEADQEAGNFRTPPPELLALWETLSDQRNDLAHHGLREANRAATNSVRDESSRSASTSTAPGRSSIRRLRDVASSLGIEV